MQPILLLYVESLRPNSAVIPNVVNTSSVVSTLSLAQSKGFKEQLMEKKDEVAKGKVEINELKGRVMGLEGDVARLRGTLEDERASWRSEKDEVRSCEGTGDKGWREERAKQRSAANIAPSWIIHLLGSSPR